MKKFKNNSQYLSGSWIGAAASSRVYTVVLPFMSAISKPVSDKVTVICCTVSQYAPKFEKPENEYTENFLLAISLSHFGRKYHVPNA